MGSSTVHWEMYWAESDGGQGTHHNAAVVDASYDSRTRAGGLGKRHTAGMEGRITVVV